MVVEDLSAVECMECMEQIHRVETIEDMVVFLRENENLIAISGRELQSVIEYLEYQNKLIDLAIEMFPQSSVCTDVDDLFRHVMTGVVYDGDYGLGLNVALTLEKLQWTSENVHPELMEVCPDFDVVRMNYLGRFWLAMAEVMYRDIYRKVQVVEFEEREEADDVLLLDLDRVTYCKPNECGASACADSPLRRREIQAEARALLDDVDDLLDRDAVHEAQKRFRARCYAHGVEPCDAFFHAFLALAIEDRREYTVEVLLSEGDSNDSISP